MPYIKGLGDDIARCFKKNGYTALFTIPKKLDSLIKKGKDKLALEKSTGVVYSINCNECDVVYVGQTKRNLQTCINEHRNNIKKHESYHSVVSKHRECLNHDFNWSKPTILHREKFIRKREIEMIFI